MSEFFFRIGRLNTLRLNTLVLKNHFVCEWAVFSEPVSAVYIIVQLPPSARFHYVQVHIRGENARTFPT